MLHIMMNIISACRNLAALNYVIRPYASLTTLVATVTAIKALTEAVIENNAIIEGIAESSTLQSMLCLFFR
jgi:hypothetical protein